MSKNKRKKNIAGQSDNIKKQPIQPSHDDDLIDGEAAICRFADATGYNDPWELGDYGHPHESGPDGHGQW